jgi:hypothetical protein
MAKTVIALEATMNASGAEGSVKSLKAQLREAQAEVATMADKFGLTSDAAQKAAKKAAELKDAIGDAKLLTDAFNPDAKFKSFSNAISGVVGGFSALQGAQALFGDQSEDLAKTLAKVQGAMALSQGINSVLEAKDAFKVLGGVIKTNVVGAFSTLRGAIISTGLGALVVALGLVINYFSDMSDAADKAAESTKKLNEETKRYSDEGLKGETDYLERSQKLDIAKAKNRGASEKEIFNLEQQYRQLKINSLQRHYDEIKGVDAKAAQETLNQIKNLQNEIQVAELDFETTHKKKKEVKKVEQKQDSEQLIKATQASETLMLDIELERINTIEQAESDAFDESFLNYQEDLQMKEDMASAEYQLEWDLYLAKKKLTEQEKENKLKAASEIANSSMALAELIGKQTAVGKGLAIAATTIETYSAAQSAYKRGLEVPYVGMVLGPLNAAIAVAQGIQRIKAITAVKIPGGGGGGGNMPSLSGAGGVGAPIGPQMGATALQQAQINAVGNAAVQAFVLESDVSGNQERIERLNRAARIK